MNFTYTENLNRISFTKMSLDKGNKNNYIFENEKIIAPKNILNGVYSQLTIKETTIWDIEIELQEELMITYDPDLDSTHFFFLSFNATQYLNIRTNINLPIDERLLNNQSKFSSLLWASNVGVDFMLPKNTKIELQLFKIPKRKIGNILDLKGSLITQKSQLIVKSTYPLFYLLQSWGYFNHPLSLINKNIEQKFQVKTIKIRLVKYLNLVTEISNDEFNLWELYIVLSIEQELHKISAVIKPNIEQIAKKLNCTANQILILFNKMFGKSISEYHRGIHMEHARRLLESQQFSVSEVSDIMGYKNHKLFSHAFKRYYMTAPNDYRPKTEVSYRSQ